MCGWPSACKDYAGHRLLGISKAIDGKCVVSSN
jgi:hypothetical protein